MASFSSSDVFDVDPAPVIRQWRDVGDAATAAATAAGKDVAYTAIGLGILTFQRLQVRRREIEKSLGR